MKKKINKILTWVFITTVAIATVVSFLSNYLDKYSLQYSYINESPCEVCAVGKDLTFYMQSKERRYVVKVDIMTESFFSNLSAGENSNINIYDKHMNFIRRIDADNILLNQTNKTIIARKNNGKEFFVNYSNDRILEFFVPKESYHF